MFIGGMENSDKKFLKTKLKQATTLRGHLGKSNKTDEIKYRWSINLLMSMCRAYLVMGDVQESEKVLKELEQIRRKMRKYYTASTVTIQILHLKFWRCLLENDKEAARRYLDAAKDAIYMTADDREWWLFQKLFESALAM